MPRHRLNKQTLLLQASPTDKHTRPARQKEAYDNCVFVVLGFTPFVPMGPKTRPRRKLPAAFRRHAFLHQKTTPKSGPRNFNIFMPRTCDLFPVWGALGAQCSAIFAGLGVTPNLAANSALYLQWTKLASSFQPLWLVIGLRSLYRCLFFPRCIMLLHVMTTRRHEMVNATIQKHTINTSKTRRPHFHYFVGFEKVDHAGNHARLQVFVGKQTHSKTQLKKTTKRQNPHFDYFVGFEEVDHAGKNARVEVFVGKQTIPKAPQR